jgi:hypothetical protein
MAAAGCFGAGRLAPDGHLRATRRNARKKQAALRGPPHMPAWAVAVRADAGRGAATRPACIRTMNPTNTL